jgi:hypothetical protein
LSIAKGCPNLFGNRVSRGDTPFTGEGIGPFDPFVDPGFDAICSAGKGPEGGIRGPDLDPLMRW